MLNKIQLLILLSLSQYSFMLAQEQISQYPVINGLSNPSINFILKDWKVDNQPSVINNYPCISSFESIFLGYQKASKDTVATLYIDDLPPHYKLRISFDYYYIDIDSYDQTNYGLIQVDDFIQSFDTKQLLSKSNVCGDPLLKDDFMSYSFDVSHFSEFVNIIIGSDYNILAAHSQESYWGIQNFQIDYFPCDSNCNYCYNHLTCYDWHLAERYWLNMDVHTANAEGWNNNLTSETNIECNQFFIFGGGNYGSEIYKTISLDSHVALHIQFEIWTYNFNNGKEILLLLDSVQYDNIIMDDIHYFNLCPTSTFHNQAASQEFVRFKTYKIESYSHTASSIEVKFQVNNPNGDATDISWGIRNFVIYTATGDKITLESLIIDCPYGQYKASICEDCNFRCAICNGQSKYNCLSCDLIYNRQLVSNQCYCLFSDGYYEDNTHKLCQKCHYSCEKCNGPQYNDCTYCDSVVRTYDSVNNICNCPAGEFDVPGKSECFRCLNKCSSCFGPFETNCLGCKSPFQLVNNSCVCQSGYYEDSSTCIQCDSKCSTCSSAAKCDTCNIERVFDERDNCVCKNSTIPVNTYCCHYSCQDCSGTGDNQCTQCNQSGQNRQALNQYNKCVCQDRFYEDSYSQRCEPCHYSCLTCSGPDPTQCNSCEEVNEFRTLFNTECRCQNGYYHDYFYQQCRECHYSCLTCNGPNYYLCNSCDTSTRQFEQVDEEQNIGMCLCKDNYILNGTQCQLSCHHTCQTCTGSLYNQCSTCDSLNHRTIQSNICLCSDGYYDQSFNPLCQPCHYSCSTCNGPYPNNCLTCDPNHSRKLQISTCLCDTDKYDANIGQCQPCHYSCLTCSGPNKNQCTSCDINDFRFFNFDNQCLCEQQEYDDGYNSLCSDCHQTCQTCSGPNADQCLTCINHQNRILNNNNCQCKDGFYDDGINFECQQCHYSCQKCTTFHLCSQCNSLKFRYADSNQCLCETNKFDDGYTQECKSCHRTCLSCDGYLQNQCITCDAVQLRYLDNNTCRCQDRKFDDGISSICQDCHLTCLTCYGPQNNQCLSCNSEIDDRIKVGLKCQCREGKYDNQSSICEDCHYSCKSCQDQMKCLSCDLENDYRVLVGQECICVDGKYNEINMKQCLSCHQSCLTCSGKERNECLSCDVGQYRQLKDNECKCQMKKFDDGTNLMCQNCHSTCLRCNGPEFNNCLVCDETFTHRRLTNNECRCQEGKYERNNELICQDIELVEKEECHYSCQQCNEEDSNYCTECNETRVLQDGKCICAGNKIDILNNQHCQGNNIINLIAVDTIQCQDGYFKENNQCFQCHYVCATCQGHSMHDCIKCQTDQQIIIPSIQSPLLSKYYIFMDIPISGSVQPYHCDKSTTSQLNNNIQYQWNLYQLDNQNNKIQISNNQPSQLHDSQFDIIIQPYTLTTQEKYEFDLQVWDSTQPTLKFGPTYTWYIESSELTLNILGGNRKASISKEFILEAELFDLDIQYDPINDLSNYIIEWQCIDPILQADCKDRDSNDIILESDTLSLHFPKQTFSYEQTYQFIVRAKRREQEFIEKSVFIQFILEDLIDFQLKVDQQLFSRKVNPNEYIDLEFNYDKDPTKIYYHFLNLIQQNQNIAAIQLNHYKSRLKLSNYITQFTLKQLTLKAIVFDPSYSLPSISQISLSINIPPQKCQILVKPIQIEEFDKQTQIIVQGCLDDDLPISYKYGFYSSYDSMQTDILSANQLNLQVLQDYTQSPKLISMFACASNDCDIILFVETQDSLGGISNYTQSIQIKKQEKINLDELDKQIDQMDLEQQLKCFPQIINRFQGIYDDKSISQIKNKIFKIASKARKETINQQYQRSIAKIISILQQEKDIEIFNNELDNSILGGIINNLIKAKQSQTKNKLNIQNIIDNNVYQAEQLACELSGKISNIKLINNQSNMYKQQYLQITDDLSKILLINSYPNEHIKTIQTPQFNISASIMTQYHLEQILGPILSDQARITQQTEQNNSYYNYKQIESNQNPYKDNEDYPYKDQNYSSVNPSITLSNSEQYNITEDKEDNQIELKQSLSFEIRGDENKVENETCISKSNNNTWDETNCKTKKQTNGVKCECKQLKPTSVVNDVKGMFSKSLITENSFSNIARFKWWVTVIFYIICLLTLLSLVLGIYGYILDVKQKDKIMPIHEVKDEDQKLEFRDIRLIRLRQKKEMQNDSQISGVSPMKTNKTSTLKMEQFENISQISKDVQDQDIVNIKDLDKDRKNEKDQKLKKTFGQYFLENYQWTNVIFVFEKELGRPLRASLIYLTVIIELVTTLYFGRQFDIQRILIVVGLSAIITKVFVTIFKKSIGSKNYLLKVIGCFLYFTIWGLLILITLSLVASSGSEEQANIWALQYAINFTAENLVISVVELIIKYIIVK